MQERTGVIQFSGNPMTLIGPEIKVGDKAPNFKVVDNDLQSVALEDFKGKTKIICTVPSLDTPVCDAEIRRFNQEAVAFSDDILVLTISMDLPFALNRWCGAVGGDRIKTLSDYQELSFAASYGVLVKELKLLTRAIFIIDADDIVSYVQLVPEITEEPDYSSVLAAVANDIPTKEVPGDGFCGAY